MQKHDLERDENAQFAHTGGAGLVAPLQFCTAAGPKSD